MDKEQYYLEIAQTVAKRSKCVSLNVGAILVKDDRIISTGINGTPRGYTNCCDRFHAGDRTSQHSEWSQKFEIHAEMNCIIQCPTDTRGSSMFCTHSPCHNCLKHMIAAGVESCIFIERYWRMTDDQWFELHNFALENNFELIQRRL